MGSKQEVKKQFNQLGDLLAKKGISINKVKAALKRFKMEVPSWVFGAFGGGRFGAFTPPGAARNVFEKFDDANLAAKLTGGVDNVAVHTGWDMPEGIAFDKIKADDYSELSAYTKKLKVGIGAVNPTLFLEGTHFGSLSALDSKTRRRFIKHCIVSSEIAVKYGTGLVTYWLTDGSNYPGQSDMAQAEVRVQKALAEIYKKSPNKARHLIEYKLFEPGTYSTVIQDAGIAKDLAAAMGNRAGVLVDMGHHAFGVNIAQIVARLIAKNVPGGFHFNSRYAADDDHSVEPDLRMFEIFAELVKGGAVANTDPKKNWAYMIDQCSGLENRMHAILHSIDSLQISCAKALIIDYKKLAEMQAGNDIIRANRVMLDAYLTDVRPLVAQARIEMGGEADPIEAYVKSGYQEKIQKIRD